MAQKPAPLAIFDVDNTFIRGDSFYRFCWFTARLNGVGIAGFGRFIRDGLRCLSGGLDVGSFKRTCLNMVLSGCDSATLKLQIDEFVERTLIPQIYADGLARLRQHRQAHRTLVFLSASPDLYLKPFGSKCGVDRAICTRFLDAEGDLIGKGLIANCRGEEKKRRLLGEFPDRSIAWDQSYGYGNSLDDVPFLEMLGHPVAVNPDRKLRRLAVERRWPIETWS